MTADPRKPLVLRAASIVDDMTSRLGDARCTALAFADGTPATLRLQHAAPANLAGCEGLPVSTEFGPARWFDYETLLLTCTGIDCSHASTSSARDAFVRYALAALPRALRIVLGEPAPAAIADTGFADAGTSVAVRISLELPALRVAMYCAMPHTALAALLSRGDWQRMPVAVAPWLLALPSRHRLVAGCLLMSPAEIGRFAPGDMIRLPAPAFDVTGIGRFVVERQQLTLRWDDALSCFEVQHVSTDPTPTFQHPNASATQQSEAVGPIEHRRLPVTLSFVIGTLTMPLGDVAAIRTGSLIRLTEGMPPTVRVEANGVHVGYGELIDCDGRLAVEITQWPGDMSGTTGL